MAFGKKDDGIVQVRPANIRQTAIRIKGTSPYVQCKFAMKTRMKMLADMATPKAAKKAKTERPPRNYDEDYAGAQHISKAGWNGMPCVAFRAAMIDACRTVGLVMTRAKMSVFVQPDGFDVDDGTPLVRIHGDGPHRIESPVRNDNGGADIRIRAMWRTWWADVTVSWDEDMITADSVINLMDRAGRQVGVGEGRPYSRDSVGQGWGTFAVSTSDDDNKETE